MVQSLFEILKRRSGLKNQLQTFLLLFMKGQLVLGWQPFKFLFAHNCLKENMHVFQNMGRE